MILTCLFAGFLKFYKDEKIIQNATIEVTHYIGDKYIKLWIIYDDNSHGIAFEHMSIFSKDDDIEKCKNEYCELDFSHNGGGLACDRIPIEELKNAYLQIDDFLNNKRKDIDILMKCYNSQGTQKYDAFYMKIKYDTLFTLTYLVLLIGWKLDV